MLRRYRQLLRYHRSLPYHRQFIQRRYSLTDLHRSPVDSCRSVQSTPVRMCSISASRNICTHWWNDTPVKLRARSGSPNSIAAVSPTRESLRVFAWSGKNSFIPIVTNRSKGSKLWDVDGNEYIDMVNGYGPIMFGHAPEFVSEAIGPSSNAATRRDHNLRYQAKSPN